MDCDEFIDFVLRYLFIGAVVFSLVFLGGMIMFAQPISGSESPAIVNAVYQLSYGYGMNVTIHNVNTNVLIHTSITLSCNAYQVNQTIMMIKYIDGSWHLVNPLAGC